MLAAASNLNCCMNESAKFVTILPHTQWIIYKWRPVHDLLQFIKQFYQVFASLDDLDYRIEEALDYKRHQTIK